MTRRKFSFPLPNGGSTNLENRSKADTFLAQNAGRPFLSDALKQAQEIRDRTDTPQGKELVKAIKPYAMISNLADNASEHAFNTQIADSELKFWMVHAAAVARKIRGSPRWIQGSDIAEHDWTLLLALAKCCYRDRFVRMVNDDHGSVFLAVALMFAACQLPVTKRMVVISGPFLLLVRNALQSNMSIMQKDQGEGEAEYVAGVFKRIEATGLLGQYLRCAIIVPAGELHALHIESLSLLYMYCTKMIWKKFTSNKSPTGEVFRSVLARASANSDITGQQYNPAVLRRLQNMAAMASCMEQGLSARRFMEAQRKQCALCHKEESAAVRLMQCIRCKHATYCSKVCQEKDWKMHKRVCTSAVVQDETRDAGDIDAQFMAGFLKKHAYAVMKELVSVMESNNITNVRDILLKLDFWADGNGKVPALLEPPKFEICALRPYVEERRVRISKRSKLGFSCLQ